jgi:hypothetical protein
LAASTASLTSGLVELYPLAIFTSQVFYFVQTQVFPPLSLIPGQPKSHVRLDHGLQSRGVLSHTYLANGNTLMVHPTMTQSFSLVQRTCPRMAESVVQEAIDTEWGRLDVSKGRTLYSHQLKVLRCMARRQHVILQAPTGCGKSTPLFLGARVIQSLNALGFYGANGFAADRRLTTLLIQPFTALLKATVKAATDMGFKAAFIGSEQTSADITRYSLASLRRVLHSGNLQGCPTW